MKAEEIESSKPLRLFPEKLFYKIGEASEIVGEKPHVLRYWENEFPFLSPRKGKSKQRVYTKRDLDLLLQIKRLLRDEGLTVDGVRRKLGGNLVKPEGSSETPRKEMLRHEDDMLAYIKKRLRSIIESIS